MNPQTSTSSSHPSSVAALDSQPGGGVGRMGAEIFTMSDYPATLYEAARLFGIYTAGRFQLWQLTGNAKASIRAHIMAALQGVDRVPRSEAGITALREKFIRQAGIGPDCLAAQEDALARICAELTTAQEPAR